MDANKARENGLQFDVMLVLMALVILGSGGKVKVRLGSDTGR
jgi:hypothetical protein